MIALDFSKAFDSVRHSAVLEKYSLLNIPDNIYNWVESFFRDHQHCNRFGDAVSQFRTIMASVIQGSGIGPVSFVVTASDLHPITPGNFMIKYADDTYLIVPAFNSQSCSAEIAHIEDWARENNLTLNRFKSAEIVFVSPRSRRAVVIPPLFVPGLARVESIKALGVTISRRFSVTQHVDNLLAACARTLFALRTLRNHGLPTSAIHAVFQATVIAKLCYASPAWWGFTSAADRGRLVAFVRRSARLGYRDDTAKTLSSLCDEADSRLFTHIITNPRYLIYSLLSPIRDQHYLLRERSHNRELPFRTSALSDKNFMMRVLYKDMGLSQSSLAA